MKNSFKKLLNGMLVASTASMASAATTIDIPTIVDDMTGNKLLTGVTKQASKKLLKYVIKFGKRDQIGCIGITCSIFPF